MTQQYEIGQKVRTTTGETAEIFRVESFGDSILYECWVTGRGMLMIHQSNLSSK